jgi:hypothetical protein
MQLIDALSGLGWMEANDQFIDRRRHSTAKTGKMTIVVVRGVWKEKDGRFVRSTRRPLADLLLC